MAKINYTILFNHRMAKVNYNHYNGSTLPRWPTYFPDDQFPDYHLSECDNTPITISPNTTSPGCNFQCISQMAPLAHLNARMSSLCIYIYAWHQVQQIHDKQLIFSNLSWTLMYTVVAQLV